MSVIDVVNQFEKNIIQFNSENMQEVVARINDYILKNGRLLTVMLALLMLTPL